MNSGDFFESLAHHFEKNLPFVAYRKPNTDSIKALLQKNSELYITKNFTEIGFVFAAFDDNEDAVIIPIENSNTINCRQVISTKNKKSQITEILKKNNEEIPVDTGIKLNKEYHVNLVQKGIDAIRAKQFQKVVLSRKESVSVSETNPISVFKRLLSEYLSAFVYVWFHPKVGLWLGATPETLLKIDDSCFSTMALAGTQQYKGTIDVQWKNKEKLEQQLVSDYIVDNLKEVVTDLRVSNVKTIKAGSLLHLKSDISGSFNYQANYLQLLIEILHPTPAVCGFPKEMAKQFILDNENYDREFYTGFLGELEINNATLFVNLRCMQLKNSKAILYVGGGITKDSIRENEWEETLNKAEIIKRVL